MSESAKIVNRNAARKGQLSKDGLMLALKSEPTRGSKMKVYQFGSAKLTVRTSPQADGVQNVDLGRLAMKKIKCRLAKPGVKLRGAKSAPLFHADPSNPRQLIRNLKGKRERGVFENGVFKVTA